MHILRVVLCILMTCCSFRLAKLPPFNTFSSILAYDSFVSCILFVSLSPHEIAIIGEPNSNLTASGATPATQLLTIANPQRLSGKGRRTLTKRTCVKGSHVIPNLILAAYPASLEFPPSFLRLLPGFMLKGVPSV